MTVNNNVGEAGPYDCGAGTLTFQRPFPVARLQDIRLFHYDAQGIETEITTGFVNTGSLTAGDVVFTSGSEPVDGVLLVRRITALVQDTDYSNQARVQPEQVERDLDRSMMIDQEANRDLSRSLRVSPLLPYLPVITEIEGGRTLVFSDDGQAIVPGPTAGEVAAAQSNAERAEEAADRAEAAADGVTVISYVEGVIGTYTEAHPSQNTILLPGHYAGKQMLDVNLGFGADQYPSGFNAEQIEVSGQRFTSISPVSGDWPIGAAFYVKGSLASASDPLDAANRAEAAAVRAEEAEQRLVLGERITFTIGPTGDFPTINAFIMAAARYRPMPDPNYVPAGGSVYRTPPMVTAVIQAGFTMAEQVFLDGGDYSHIEVWGPDGINVAPTVSVPVQRSAVTKRAPGSEEFYPIFFTRNCIGPRIRARFALDTSGSNALVRGLHVTNSVTLFTGGVTDCTERGAVPYAGFADLSGAKFDRAGEIGIRPANQATVLLTGATATGCGTKPGGGSGERAGLHARGAEIDAVGLDLSGSLGEGAIFVGCKGRIEGLTVAGAATNGLRASGCIMIIPSPVATGCGGTAIVADRGAVLTVQGANVSGSATGFSADNSSKIDAQQANANGCGVAVRAANASEISFRTGTGTACTGSAAVIAESASTVNASSADFTGYLGANCVVSRGLSRVNLDAAKVTQADLTPRATDVDFYTGSQINMTGAIGGWHNQPTVNALNGSRGIVWKQ